LVDQTKVYKENDQTKSLQNLHRGSVKSFRDSPLRKATVKFRGIPPKLRNAKIQISKDDYQRTMPIIPFLSLVDALSQFWGYIVELIVTVVGLLIAEHLYSLIKKPKIYITPITKGDRLGFSVSVEKKMVKDARVRCNNRTYMWENGEARERKDLHIGDEPSSFYPYSVNSKYLKDASDYTHLTVDGAKTVGYLLTTIIELYVKIVFQCAYPIIEATASPETTASPFESLEVKASPPYYSPIHASIRIIGEGIEEKRDYSLAIGLKNLKIPIKEGKPSVEGVSYNFELVKKPHILKRLFSVHN
jgi:hypothetical protein